MLRKAVAIALLSLGAILSYLKFGMTIDAIFVYAVVVVLIVISFIDIYFQVIPDELNLLLFVVGVAMILLGFESAGVGAAGVGPALKSAAMGFLAVSLPMLILTTIISGAFGGGDIKLCAAMGVVLGSRGIILATIIGLLLGGFYGMYLLIIRRREKNSYFPLGPFLAVGMVAALFFDVEIVDWMYRLWLL